MKQFTKEELEELETLTESHCNYGICVETINDLATALLEEQEKVNHAVWEGAPEWDGTMLRYFKKEEGDPLDAREGAMQKHTRELPKTRADIIAEEESARYNRECFTLNRAALKDLLKTAILKREAELEAGK